MWWPTPPRVKPRWWHFKAKRLETDLSKVFGQISDEQRDAYWREIRKGQSVYEDAGGFVMRAYRAMAGLPVEEPYTYPAAIHDLLEGRDAL